MSGIAIFVAKRDEAQEHLGISIKNPFPLTLIEKHLSPTETQILREIEEQQGGLYAWGATPGTSTRNANTWAAIREADHVFASFDKTLHYHAQVVHKMHNANAAKAIWGTDDLEQTWQYMYFLTPPSHIHVPLQLVTPYMDTKYQGFRRKNQERIMRIEARFGSVDRFMEHLYEISATPAPEFISAPTQADRGSALRSWGAPEPDAAVPPWSRDEAILALSNYLLYQEGLLTDQEALEGFSETLRSLPIHPMEGRPESFRSAREIEDRNRAFRVLDPNTADPERARVTPVDLEVWNEFAKNPEHLHAAALAIKRMTSELPNSPVLSDEDEVFPEGALLTRIHLKRERNARAVRLKKEGVLSQTGRLACEVCKFDFLETYGELGRGFAECHHKVPVSELEAGQGTRLEDLAIVCSNCHRMLHRRAGTVLDVEELERILNSHRTLQ